MLDRPSPRPLKTLSSNPGSKAGQRVKKLDINRLKDPAVSANFNKSMDAALERMRCLANPSDDANQKWVRLRDVVHATAANTLGYKKRHNQDWFDENDGISHLF